MSIKADGQLLTFGGWTFRYRPADRPLSPLAMLLHGWTGDEDSMSVFSRNIPAQYAVLTPRAPFSAAEKGYSWRERKPIARSLPTLTDLQPAVEALLTFLDGWSASVGLEARPFDLVGFSQGAAMTYALAVLHPERVQALVVLSGFLPHGAEVRLSVLAGKPILLTHGRQDEMVPVEAARRSRALLEAAGARVVYCESDGGHVVSKVGVLEIKRFFEAIERM